MVSLIITILIVGAVCFAIGWFGQIKFGKPSPRELQAIADLAKTQSELNNYQKDVNQYLETTADLFNNVSIQYKKLYDHLSAGSAQLSTVEARVAPLEQLTNNADIPELHPDHNWHPTYFEARDALKLEDTLGIKIDESKSKPVANDIEIS